jgi:hypothetical protein
MVRTRQWPALARSLPGVVLVGLLGTIAASSADASGLPTLQAISISPSTASVVEGLTQQFTATGLLSNGTVQTITDDLTWAVSSVSGGNFASISNTGLVTGLAPGVGTITATAPTGLLGLLSPLSNSATLNVLPLLQSITISPSTASIIPGQVQQFTATGLFSDGTVQSITNDLSWSSALPSIASITNTGLATGLLPGLDTITATAPAGVLTGPLAGLLSPITSVADLNVFSPTMSITPPSGKRRTVVTIQGSNFTPSNAVVVTYLSGVKSKKLASTELCTAEVASNGTFSCVGQIPHGARAGKDGNHTVTAAVAGGTSGSTTFDLLKGTARPR